MVLFPAAHEGRIPVFFPNRTGKNGQPRLLYKPKPRPDGGMADAADLKSATDKVYGFKSRSGYHFIINDLQKISRLSFVSLCVSCFELRILLDISNKWIKSG